MVVRTDASSDALLAEISRQAVAGAAARLQVDPYRLARGLGDGRIADLLLELRSTAYWAHPRDRDRIESLLDEVYLAIRGRDGDGRAPAARRTGAVPAEPGSTAAAPGWARGG